MTDYGLIGPDLVLLLLAAPGRGDAATNRVNGITRLEKLLFLADKETNAVTNVCAPPTHVPTGQRARAER